MFTKILHLISAERSSVHNKVLSPTIAQHRKVYTFCKQFVKNKDIIEIGCGNGYGSYELSTAAKSVAALDNDVFAIEACKKEFQKENLTFIQSSIEEFTYAKKSDGVICLQVIEHLENPEILLLKARSLLKKNGIFILSTPNAETQSYNENPYHLKEFTAYELKQLLTKYFKDVTIYGLFGDSVISSIEEKRREQIIRVLQLDTFKLRNKIPRTMLQRMFDIATLANRFLISLRTKQQHQFSENNFTIKKTTQKSIDLLAVCSGIV